MIGGLNKFCPGGLATFGAESPKETKDFTDPEGWVGS